MKTICSLLVTLFITFVLVASAGNNTGTATVTVTCTPSDCTGPIQFDYSNLNPHAYYTFTGASDTGDTCCGDTAKANSDGTLTFANTSFLSAGNWVFNITEVHKNGNAVHDGLSLDTPVDVP